MDKFGFKREKSVWLITLFLFLAGIPSALDLNILGTVDSILEGITNIWWVLGNFLYGMGSPWKVQ